jgi:hypothetical protein
MQLFYTDPDAQALAQVVDRLTPDDKTFAEKLLDASRNWLSPKQRHWVGVLTKRATEPKREPIKFVKFAGVVDLLDKAAEKLKHPKLLVRVQGRDLRLSISGPMSRAPGSINVSSTERAYDDRTWFGRVARDGTFEPARSLDDDTLTAITAALTALAHNPAAVASAYGQETGACCFCGLELTDARSIHVGYGPVCSEKWGVPWGDAPPPKVKAPNNIGVYLAPRHDSRSAAAKRAAETRKRNREAAL